MNEEKFILTMLAETYIHPGSGQSTSHVDLPVSRERTTDYPFISSTSLKGAFLSNYRKRKVSDEKRNKLFGTSDQMGAVNFSDTRILLLPVRSLQKLYYWVTCPYILERLNRDLRRTGNNTFNIDLDGNSAYSTSEGTIHLEEREFEVKEFPKSKDGKKNGIVDVLAEFIPDDTVKSRLKDQLVVLSNEEFKWFANYGLPVLARNQLDEKTKESKNVWYEEYLPVDTVMYSVIYSKENFDHGKYLQIGANETVGQGWFRLGKYGGK